MPVCRAERYTLSIRGRADECFSTLAVSFGLSTCLGSPVAYQFINERNSRFHVFSYDTLRSRDALPHDAQLDDILL